LTYNTFRKAKSAVAEEHLMSDAALAIPLVISTPPIMMNETELKNKKQSEKDKKRVISDLYNFGRTVGTGTFSIVKKCKLLKTGGIFAVKICNRSKMNPTLEHRLQDEISILSNLNHPNIIRFYDTFVSTNSYYLITEYLDGGELFDRIVEKHTYTEKEARDVCSIIFDAVNHCHMHRITHRDLKPENLLLLSRDNDTNLKIADFGFAKMTPSEDSLTTFCGSPMFVSPEILNKKPYGTKTDMWSIGVREYLCEIHFLMICRSALKTNYIRILFNTTLSLSVLIKVIVFCLLSGYSPFQHEDQEKQFDNIKCARYSFYDKYWHNITNEAKSLIRSLLTVDPLKRISAQAAMAHPWMKVESDRLRRTSLVLSQENLSFGYNSKTSSEGAIKSSIRMKAVDENSQVTSSMLAAVTAAAAAYSNDTLTEDDDAIPQNNITNDNDTVIAANVREGDKLYYEKGEQRTKVNVTVLKIHRDDFPNLYFTIKEDGSYQERQTVAERLKWNNDIDGRRVTDAVTNIQRAVRRRSAAKMTPVVQQQQQRSTTRSSPRSPPPPTTSSLRVVSTAPTRGVRVSIDPPAHEAANIQRALRRPSNIKKIWL
jgi:serine/threonine protein kinase